MNEATLYLPKWFRVVYQIGRQQETYAMQIGKKEEMCYAHLAKVIRQLLKKGYINRTINPGNKQQKILTLTNKGKDLYQAIETLARMEQMKK